MALLVLQGLAFVAWAFLAFRSLFRLRARAVAASGSAFPGVAATLAAFADFLRHPSLARDRKALGLATLVLVATNVLTALLRPI